MKCNIINNFHKSTELCDGFHGENCTLIFSDIIIVYIIIICNIIIMHYYYAVIVIINVMCQICRWYIYLIIIVNMHIYHQQ